MTSTAPDELANLVQQLDQALPQTQCTRCGYPDCRRYAEAIAAGEAQINQCPPGGDEGVRRLALLTGKPVLALNPDNGIEATRALAVIDESWCIGCTLCIKACPVDCVVGAPKQMHVIVADQCTGCELCLPACPVDCISMVEVSEGRTAWDAWSQPQANEARQRYQFHQLRVARSEEENEERLRLKAEAKLADVAAASKHTDPKILDAKRAVIEAALARARARAK
ncbi:electron transport complex subunit RsxB [Pelomonas sp. V22]|uniref:electron transport complex subunit RsxB n=1 Tax=Pelomonas sp. V22 TaxID=2822139 RepID=UPI0024A870DC|nr:electron transport complex subunit RsxB [Pelomonas sp. V22]MDI4633345.1 electron transport complex subunit RsxB [Pelomonas sp. V22]